jgi:hypothetical protein
MKINLKVEKFCSLVDSPSWQAWLWKFDHNLYNKFMAGLRASKNCTQNSELMIIILNMIQDVHGGSEKLFEFITSNYPHMLAGEDSQPLRVETPQNVSGDNIFPNYVPGVLTYPRRIILVGNGQSLKKRVNSFVLDKIKHDTLIVGDKAYIEYLTAADSNILAHLPMKNWLIAAYRARKL